MESALSVRKRMKIKDLGKTDYLETLNLQRKLFNEKIKNPRLKDIILITQHYPVYTKGKTTSEEHIPQPIEDIPVIEIERGGSITFHGEGQIVVYPIITLSKKLSVRNYVSTLEQIMIDTLKEFGIDAFREEKRRGVFTEKGKIGFVGVKISRYTTMHGFSLNVNVDKKYFERIIPCGISDKPVCSMSDFIKDIKVEDVEKVLIKHIKEKLEK